MSNGSAKWEEIAALQDGDLATISYPMILLALSRTGRSGVLEMMRKPVEKRIVFEAGVPVDCRSNLVHETFGRFLVAVGKLSEEDFRAVLADSASRDLPLGEVVLERGILDAAELYKLLQQCLARKLLDGFTWRAGSFRVTSDQPEVDSTLKIRVPQLILTGVLKLSPLDEVTRGIRGLMAEPLALNPSPPYDEDDMQVRGPAGEALAALRGRPLRMDELAHKLPQLPGNDLGRVLYALSLLEMVIPASRLQAAPRPAPPRPADTSTVPASPAASEPDPTTMTRPIARPSGLAAPLSERELEKAKDRVLQAYLTYRRKDAFDLLAVAETATLGEIESRWLEFAQSYAPWVLEGLASPDYVDKARALFLCGAEAYADLRDSERRGHLLHRRKIQREQRAQKPRGGDRIQTDLLDPEAQFRKGMEMLAAGQDRKALELLQYAADLDAQNAVYRAEAAWCRFRVLADKKRSQEDLEEAVRADPRCGIAYYYLGMIQGQDGALAMAEDSLRKAIKLMAPDRRPIDALKELTTKKK